MKTISEHNIIFCISVKVQCALNLPCSDWIQFVMRRCLTSDVFCDTFASYFKTLIHHKTYGRMIRNVTIDNLQELYEGDYAIFRHICI